MRTVIMPTAGERKFERDVPTFGDVDGAWACEAENGGAAR
jgi:hypothetical protein